MLSTENREFNSESSEIRYWMFIKVKPKIIDDESMAKIDFINFGSCILKQLRKITTKESNMKVSFTTISRLSSKEM